MLLVIALLALLVWLAGRYEAAQVQNRVEHDAAQAVEDVRSAFLRNVQGLQALYYSDPTPGSWQVDAAAYLREHRELLHLEWRDPGLRLVSEAQTPFRSPLFGPAGRGKMSSDISLTCSTARRFSGPAYGNSYFVPMADGLGLEVMEMCLPLVQGGKPIGFLLATYSLQGVLELLVGPQITRNYEISFTEGDGTRLALRGSVRRGSRVFTARQLMDLPATTLVLRDEIRRVPKRADLFTRALAGDLGEKARTERSRFAVKHPLALAMTPLIRALVPLQGTREPLQPTGLGGDLSDPQRNAQAIKALAHVMGADLVGICEAEPWMYYSHDEVEGRPIEPYHRYAVVMLIDQGFETMEGASGDDWISGAQSMRAYLRGATMAGVMAAHVRRMGYSARAHSNAHSELLHLPAVLMAGLGELSRIGELILNPFIGPRSKSVLFTTDLPLAVDKPIDFGLQAMCNLCMKCARECPCNAIPFGPKVMFNGYEIWKPDVEKCGKYRLTNMKGSACGRCMKTCPYNREDLVESERLLWLSIDVPASRRQLIAHDDSSGGGQRNAVKRWWFDLEIVDGRAVAPPGGVNERDLDPSRTDKLAAVQKLAFYPPALQPAGGTTLQTVSPIDRPAGLQAYAAAESPLAARRRRDRGTPKD